MSAKSSGQLRRQLERRVEHLDRRIANYEGRSPSYDITERDAIRWALDIIDGRISAAEPVLLERVKLAERHLAEALSALDVAHDAHGCACPVGRCVLAADWVPPSIRRECRRRSAERWPG